jgi:hypothetical protein
MTNHEVIRDGSDVADSTDVATAASNQTAPRVLTIDRSKWRRGRLGTGSPKLLNEAGFMCCLGFEALACGLTPEQIINANYPFSLLEYGHIDATSDYAKSHIEVDSETFYHSNTPAAARAAIANDNPNIDEEERERRVRAALIELGLDDVVFIDGPAS